LATSGETIRVPRVAQELGDGKEVVDDHSSFFLAGIERPVWAADENGPQADRSCGVNIAVHGVANVDRLGGGPTSLFECQGEDRWVRLVGTGIFRRDEILNPEL
jgi:hypothetical protein